MAKKIKMADPQIGKAEINAVVKVLKSKNLAQGEKVLAFEKEFAKYVGVKHAIAVNNGTTGLHLALLSAGIKAGDEVITTPFSFIATAFAILYCGAVPVFADITEDDFNLDPKSVEKLITKKTRAILPVHLYGQCSEMDALQKLAKKYKLKLIEDACQAHGATFGKIKAGALGDVAVFSLYSTKNIMTGEGGMLTTNDDSIAEKARTYRNQGMKVRYYHDVLGYNYRMTDISGALGLEQLKKLNKFNKSRAQNAKFYIKNLSNISGLILPKTFNHKSHVFHQFTIRVTSDFKMSREELIKKFEKAEIATGIFYPLALPDQKLFENYKFKSGKIPVTRKIQKEVLSLPVHPSLSNKDLDRVVKVFYE